MVRKRIVLAVFSAILSLFAAEGVLRLIVPPYLQGAGTVQTPKATRYGWALPPGKTFRFSDPDDGSISFFRINSQGWKDTEHSIVKPPDVKRILILGDSNTFGVVPLRDLYTRKVESLLRDQGIHNIEVISMGIGGWGTDHALEALAGEGIQYSPDIVIYQFCGNDITDNLFPRKDTPPEAIQQKKPFRYFLHNGKLVRESRETGLTSSPDENGFRKALRNSALFYHFENIFFPQRNAAKKTPEKPAPGRVRKDPWWVQFPINPDDPYFIYHAGLQTPELKEAWDLFEALLLQMKEVSQSHHSAFLVFSEESEEGKRQWNLNQKRLLTDGSSDFVFLDGKKIPVDWRRPLTDLQRVCTTTTIPLIIPQGVYERYTNDPHPNASGNLRMAKDIVQFLIASGLV